MPKWDDIQRLKLIHIIVIGIFAMLVAGNETALSYLEHAWIWVRKGELVASALIIMAGIVLSVAINALKDYKIEQSKTDDALNKKLEALINGPETLQILERRWNLTNLANYEEKLRTWQQIDPQRQTEINDIVVKIARLPQERLDEIRSLIR